MRLLLFNLATDREDPILGFTTRWICALAQRVESIHVITMTSGRVDVPDNVEVYSVGKERGYSEARRVIEFYRLLVRVLRKNRIDVCFSNVHDAAVYRSRRTLAEMAARANRNLVCASTSDVDVETRAWSFDLHGY